MPRKNGAPASGRLVRRRRAAVIPYEKVRELCLSLPDVEEKLSHGSRTFFTRKRTFLMFANNHHDDGNIAVWCNASEGAQEILVASDPDTFFIPPYVGCRGWIGVRLNKGITVGQITDVVKNAHASTARAAASRRTAAKRRSRA